ncbi:TadE/TadG family type IV pilus assembly protein [Planctomicrobium sp. SH668]|uniref:TadE/TadG family type IV pilus assembly protein n=1 Tax=Planctomicrobium sp. SH668 TaxID=3448126 RepID=UPI003F5CAD3E
MLNRKPSIRTQSTRTSRSGLVLVETAVVAAVFGVFLAGILEVSHAYMVTSAMNAAAKRAARFGSVDGVTTAEATNFARSMLKSSIRPELATIVVKNATSFESPTFNPATVNYNSLPNYELSTGKRSEMFIVRITVPYRNISLLPPFWLKNATLKAQAATRHE